MRASMSGSAIGLHERNPTRRPTHLTPRIIVAEDDEEMRRLIVATLEKDGYYVEQVTDGMRLLVHVVALADDPQRAFDLIISDLRMPASTGLQILRGLRNSGWKVPFILCTAFGDEPTRTDVENLDAIYFDKPFELDDLRKTVRSILLSNEKT
ncbi:MAG TPA: response regulator [Polyangiaceae bacterium]|nr:response regulator [Polyangiaceae bacterium]